MIRQRSASKRLSEPFDPEVLESRAKARGYRGLSDFIRSSVLVEK